MSAQTPEAAAAAAEVRARAALLLQEQRDEVKRMNQMVLYSKCAAERDAQVRVWRLVAVALQKARRCFVCQPDWCLAGGNISSDVSG